MLSRTPLGSLSCSLWIAAGLLLSPWNGPWSGAQSEAHAADPSVSLELVTEPGFPINGQQSWLQFLRDRQFGFSSVRIRSARASDELKIDNRGSASSPRYTVTGIITTKGQLALPGIVVRRNQHKELAEWLRKLREGGEELATSATVAFGLTPKQLTQLHDALQKRVTMSTRDASMRDVLQHIERTVKVPIKFDAGAQQLLYSDNKAFDELQGVTSGTALVAAVRPYGLLVVPTGQGTRSVGLSITKKAEPKDAWPLGAPVTKGLQGTASSLMKYINVEIVDQPLDETLDKIQARLKLPFLYDHNAIARHEIDLHATVELPAKRMFYKRILTELLRQQKLRCDVRTDDAGTAFVWITSIRP